MREEEAGLLNEDDSTHAKRRGKGLFRFKRQQLQGFLEEDCAMRLENCRVWYSDARLH